METGFCCSLWCGKTFYCDPLLSLPFCKPRFGVSHKNNEASVKKRLIVHVFWTQCDIGIVSVAGQVINTPEWKALSKLVFLMLFSYSCVKDIAAMWVSDGVDIICHMPVLLLLAECWNNTALHCERLLSYDFCVKHRGSTMLLHSLYVISFVFTVFGNVIDRNSGHLVGVQFRLWSTELQL